LENAGLLAAISLIGNDVSYRENRYEKIQVLPSGSHSATGYPALQLEIWLVGIIRECAN
jgi:hypothetical protein